MRYLLLLALLCGCRWAGEESGPTIYRTSMQWSYTKDCIDGWTMYHIDRGVVWALDINGRYIPCKEKKK